MAPLANVKSSSEWNCSPTKACLLLVIVIQWILFVFLLHRQQINVISRQSLPEPTTSTFTEPTLTYDGTTNRSRSSAETAGMDVGVAVTLMFRAPLWFHLRYTAMVHNALSNIPDTWKVQIVYNKHWLEKEVLPWHPSIQRWYETGHDRITFTPIPDALLNPKDASKHVKPKEIMASRWFWENVLAEHVLLFSGNGAFCGHHFDDSLSLENAMTDLDYLGTPWHHHDGYGGDGSSHSYRKRSVMLRVLDYAEKNNKQVGNDAEDVWTLDIIEKINKETTKRNVDVPAVGVIRLATPKQTQAFGGTTNLTKSKGIGLHHLPMVVPGTQSQLSFAERETLLKHCPEVKMIFPSLHEPACFGAHPDPLRCKASICALRDEIPHSGC